MEDNKIIEKVLQGEKDFYGVLMKKYFKEIFKYVYNITSSYDSSEDITQEIFIKIYSELGKYNENKASFRTWLYRIAGNYTINYVKSKAYRNNQQTSLYDDEINNSNEDIVSDVIKDEKITEINNIAATLLSSKHYQIFSLHYFSNLNVKEISETTNIPEKTIYKALKTSIEKIKKEVDFNE
ncbi:hypothetical protein CI105_02135 [Candidatus Izimaplasma bacterium ZiA1]|uniref:RNA polymerase sigma factor n=1 Tax=Candidatus Izimoplasma sp. ZiA1 TaxID=2024899 RepID=UPI000BAA6A2D|nr:hypothetical protein CI105_02135 [Candidatus Izimaplasma bacterium ZiA1]